MERAGVLGLSKTPAGKVQNVLLLMARAGVLGLSKTPAGKVQKPCVFLSSKAHMFLNHSTRFFVILRDFPAFA